MDADAPDSGPSLALCSDNEGVQMVLDGLLGRAAPVMDAVALGDDDVPSMLALATLTEPGPFFAKTHLLGDFYGIRRGGELIAMAGERMKPEGFTEISGVCCHPDHRGNGLAAGLIQLLARRIVERGENAFLHSYARNTAAIALYERLGFTVRRKVRMIRLTRV